MFFKKKKPESALGGTASVEKKKPRQMIYAIQRSELINEDSCDFCRAMDGVVLLENHAWTKLQQFHKGCRGIWVEILSDEIDPPPLTVMGAEDERELLKLKRGAK